MLIYNYDRNTKEYLYSSEAEADIAETKNKGVFVPLVPANATILPVPDCNSGEVAVFENDTWVTKTDYRKFSMVDDELNVTEITTIDKPQDCYVVDTQTGEDIINNPDRYKISNGEVVRKSDTEYETELQEAEYKRISLLSLTKRELFLALYRYNGTTPENVRALLEGNTEGLIEFDYAAEYYRGNPLINTLGTTLGFTSEQLDYLFENKELI